MRRAGGVLLAMLLVGGVAPGAQAPPAKSDIVMVAGCLKEQPAGTWRLVNALDPKPSNAVAPPANELPSMPVVGSKQFQLIGVSIFDLPSYRDQTVVVKGLLIQASPVSRLNITSVTRVAPTCAPAK
jgi:hypothetical protein